MKKKLLYVVLLLLCGTIFPLSTYGEDPCTITVDGNEKYLDIGESYEDICPLHDTLCEQYNTSVTCYTEGDDLGEWKSIANACAINVDYGYYEYYIPYGGSYPDVLYPEDGSLCSAGQYLSCDEEGYDFGDWYSVCSSCTITVDGNEEYVDVGESYGSYLYSPDNRSCEPENQPICEYEQDILGYWYTSCDPNWNTAILETNSDGDYELTYSGTTYIIASGDLAGTYKRGNNTAGNSTIYNGSENNNRWGGSGDNAANGYDTRNPRSERQGPCPKGWHVPSRGEWDAIAIAWCHLSTNNCVAGNLRVDGNGNLDRIRKIGLNTEFKLNFGISNKGYYWSSSPNENDTWRFYFGNSNIIGKDSTTRDKSFNIRCIADEYTITYELNGGELPEGVENRQTYTIGTETFTLTNPKKRDDYKFIGWSGTDLESPVTTLTISKGSIGTRHYEVVWEAIGGESSDPEAVDEKVVPDAGTSVSTGGANISLDNSIVVEGDANTGALAPAATGSQIIIQQKADTVAYKEEGVSEAQLENDFNSFVEATGMIADVNGILDVQLIYLDGSGHSEKLGSVNFSEPVRVYIPVNGWATTVKIRVKHTGESTYGTGGLTTDATVTCSDGLVVETAKQYTGGDITVNNGKALIYTCSASSFVAYSEVKPTPTPSHSGGGGGGGGGSSKTSNKMQEVVLGGEVKVNTGDENKLEENIKENETKGNEDKNEVSWCKTGDMSDVLANGYTREMNNAYTFAYKNKITTRNTIEQADIKKPLTRIAMAKMLSYYAINVLKKKPDTTRVNKFKDVSDELGAQYDNGVTLAYQLGIMGINMKNNKFRPNDYVTRAEFGTALSRLLFGTEDGKDMYYSTHLAKLMQEGIITNDTPTLQELRGYVMIMLMRSACNLGK